MSEIFIVFGDHLFPITHFEPFKAHKFLMIESYGLCEHYQYHKMRLAFILSAGRHKCAELTSAGFKVDRISLQDEARSKSYIDRLHSYCKKNNIQKIHAFEKEDKFFSSDLQQFSKDQNIKLILYRSPAFLNSHQDFKDYLGKYKNLL